ncbi:hypothetical protein KSP39_PZI018181 [Platanthera zijinensis]|uniref:porphobilinogen synthase n=1 Tax=Platanthera zijinensis TaxID=2320716 RepID=A0AAP0B3D4_9ASPA
MPGCSLLGWRHGLIDEVYKAMDVGVKSFALFPNISSKLKTPTGSEALNEDGLLPRTIRLLKDKYPEIVIYTDASLHPYTLYERDGIVPVNGAGIKDKSLRPLCLQAIAQARAGASVISVSDMIDGSIRAIRDALNAEGFDNVTIMAYTAKVIPGSSNVDIMNIFYQNTYLPIAAYQISGDYMRIKVAGFLKKVDLEISMMTSLSLLSRSGARIIFTYFARLAAAILSGDK